VTIRSVQQISRKSFGTRKKVLFLAGLIEAKAVFAFRSKSMSRSNLLPVQPEFFHLPASSSTRMLELAQEVFDTGNIRPKPGNEVVLVTRSPIVA